MALQKAMNEDAVHAAGIAPLLGADVEPVWRVDSKFSTSRRCQRSLPYGSTAAFFISGIWHKSWATGRIKNGLTGAEFR